jgi:5-formyltetrahydrofolate cyclo-ligase
MSTLRQSFISQRKKLTAQEQDSAAQVIFERLQNILMDKQNQNIACYLPIHGEVNTKNIIDHIWLHNKNCYLPVMQADKTLIFLKYQPETTLIKNHLGILEPECTEMISPEHLDVVIAPLVGFDEAGTRLGYGVGCYDRTFYFLSSVNTSRKPSLIGLAYDFQKCLSLTKNSWDIPLDVIITPTKTYIV